MFLPGFLPINFLIESLFGSVLGLLFIPSLISFSVQSLQGLLSLFFPMEMPMMPAA